MNRSSLRNNRLKILEKLLIILEEFIEYINLHKHINM